MAEQPRERHIVSDLRICHGKPTFRNTRILVSDVLDQIAEGLSWEGVILEWHGSLSEEAIAEALQLPTAPPPPTAQRPPSGSAASPPR